MSITNNSLENNDNENENKNEKKWCKGFEIFEEDETLENKNKNEKKSHAIGQSTIATTIEEDSKQVREFRYKIGFNQSVSTGVVALEGYIHFDDGEANVAREYFLNHLRLFVEGLKDEGYSLASENAPKRLVSNKHSSSVENVTEELKGEVA